MAMLRGPNAFLAKNGCGSVLTVSVKLDDEAISNVNLLNCMIEIKISVRKGWLTIAKAKSTFTFHFSTLELSNASLSLYKKEIKSESGFSLAMASQPF